MGMINACIQRISGLYSLLVVGVISVMSSPVWAQVEDLKPPRTKEAPSNPKFLVMGVAVLLLGAAIFVVTMKAKRDHQD